MIKEEKEEMVKTQIILTSEQHKVLRNLAKERDVSMAALIREAVENAYIKKVDYQEQLEALKRISSRKGDVSDWETMKKEIREGFIGKE